MLANASRAHLAEFGIVTPQGRSNLATLAAIANDHDDRRIPTLACSCLPAITGQLADLQTRIVEIDRPIRAWRRPNESSQCLQTMPGIGLAAIRRQFGYWRLQILLRREGTHMNHKKLRRRS